MMILLAATAVIIFLGAVAYCFSYKQTFGQEEEILIPSPHTNGNISMNAHHIRGGILQCLSSLGGEALFNEKLIPTTESREACENRPGVKPIFSGPIFDKKNITFTYDELQFNAKEPDKRFGLVADLYIPINATHDIILPLGSYFVTDYKITNKANNNDTTYYGHGNVTIGNEIWDAKAQYIENDYGYDYAIRVGS